MSEVFILLGGNVGDKYKIFNKTRKLIVERIGLITKLSSMYATEPWGFDSDVFWNQAVVITTTLHPNQILHQTQAIEKEMGRIKTSTSYEARTIDIDLLFYNDLVLNTPNLTLPHPKIGERKFVLVPLNEIAPQKRHPVTGMDIAQMLSICIDLSNVDLAD
jgi:2-amino-4-hydroxy-6-hydroxymethyldihydropteridine diphosphokinase